MLGTSTWIAGFAGLLIWLVMATRRARAQGDEITPRSAVIAAALAVVILGFGAAYIWGVSVADRGMARILAADRGADGDEHNAEPPRARLFLRHVQLQLVSDGSSSPEARIGYSPEASLRLPRSYPLEEAKQGWDLVRVQASGPQGLSVQPVEHPETTGTRVLVRAQRRAIGVALSPDRIAASAGSFTGRGRARCRPGKADDNAELTGPGALYVIFCRGRNPLAALVLERDLSQADNPAQSTPIRISPLVWRGGRWRPHHVQIVSGALIQIGTMADALPGVTLWEVPAPAGRAELFYPPQNLLASCPEWLSGQKRQGFFSYPGRVPIQSPATGGAGRDRRTGTAPDHGHQDDSICVLPFTPPFGMEVRRLLPDIPGISARSLWAAGLFTTPALLLLFLLCTRPRSQLTRDRFRRALAISWIAVFLSAVGVWRLLWAHRIDMLRDYEAVGARVLQNQLLLTLGAAALAAMCALAWFPTKGRTGWRALLATMLAWLLWLLVGGYALRGDLASIDVSARILGQFALSLAIGGALWWMPRARAAFAVNGRRALARLQPDDSAHPWLAAMTALLGVCVLALLFGAFAPRAVLFKLSLAWLYVLCLYAALRASLSRPGADSAGTAGGIVGWRTPATIALGLIGAGLLARFDPGVTVAIAGPGLLAALLFASHDARFADSALPMMASYRRHHAPLLLTHTGVLSALGLFVAIWSLVGLWSAGGGEVDAVLARALTLGAIHLLLIFALLFAAAGALGYLRRGWRASVPWLLIALFLTSAWLARGSVIDRVMSSSTQAANRIAIVLDPGYALLRSETKFSAGITAWRETIIPTGLDAPSAGDLWHGQGYFGAQLIDPGVLLSVENDYFPVLVLREQGISGILATALLLFTLVAGAWLISGARFRHGAHAQRARALISVVLGVVCVYQPLAALGVVPLTGISWPGFGLDSPSDFWALTALVCWVVLWGSPDADGGGDGDTGELEEFDRDLRTTRLFRQVRAAVAATATICVIASLLLCARASAFALRRPNPVDPQGRTVKPFDGLDKAVDYAFHLQCPWRQKSVPADPDDADAQARALVPDDLLGDATTGGILRFHDKLRAAWYDQRGRAISEVAGFLRGESTCGGGGRRRAGSFTFERSPENDDECLIRFKFGWPQVELAVTRAPPETDEAETPDPEQKGARSAKAERSAQGTEDGQDQKTGPMHSARCTVDVRTDIVRTLRFPARRPYRNARIRLISKAVGDAARDRGELISGQLSVRLRPGAGSINIGSARAGMYFADTVDISDQLTIKEIDGIAVLQTRRRRPRTTGGDDGPDEREAWLLLRDPPPADGPGTVQVLEADEGRWKLLPPEDTIPLTRMALLVIGGQSARSLWLFRPPSPWPGEAEAVGSLIADDVTTVRGERRRHYLFGGIIPEIGWVNPYHARMSLGLDGWVRVAMGEYERGTSRNARTLAPPTWIDSGARVPYCGPMDVRNVPLPADARTAPGDARTAADPTLVASPPAAPTPIDPTLGRVCQPSALDGVLECRVAIQPELSIRLHHLTELISLAPADYSGDAKAALPVRGNFALMRGDTGEILAQGEFVPGRASSVYAPATPEIEQHLIRLREDRDPKTGRRLTTRGEASAEKVDWSQPIAVGSTVKPILGRALELADPTMARELVLEGSKIAGAWCRRMKVHAIFGHCPPTDSLWNRNGFVDVSRFISASVNWYQATVGLLGTTAGGRGSFGFGADDSERDLTTLIGRNVGDHRPDAALWTRYRDKPIVSAGRTLRIDNLRLTPLWRRFEELLGRTLCTEGSKGVCRRQSARKDLCAARALPIDNPTSDLRYLVALGPSTFNFYPQLADRKRRVGPSVNTREYLQFLRGSGLHPIGSLVQLTDAFNRLVFQFQPPASAPGSPDQPAGGRLAASWFPTGAVGSPPPWTCAQPSNGAREVATGLCDVVRSGTADNTLGPLLADERFTLYGAKTGTIDSLADIAEKTTACAHFATGHTVPDSPADAAKQPYWLPCTKRRKKLVAVNDSLLIMSFAVRAGDEQIPLTLGLRFQRSGPGLAARVARHYLDVIHDYLAPAAPTQ